MKSRPNVLWICTDQQRWDTIGALNNEHIDTPNIDRLVAEGVACTHAFCQSPICTPSRASFLTGKYPDTIHACSNGNDAFAEAAPLVTKLLADNYYCCGLAGKLHLAGAHGRIEPRPSEDGYTVFHWSHSHRDVWPAGHAYADWVQAQGVALGAHYGEHGRMPAELHQTTFCAEKAIEFIEHAWDQPWLMSVNIFDPHPPFDPPTEYAKRYDPAQVPGPDFVEGDLEAQALLAGVDFQSVAADPDTFDARRKIADYYAMIGLIDWNIGRMLEALERTGQRENTLVIFMSDHGEMLGDHGLLLKGCRLYDALTRVPLIFSWPGVLPEGRRTDALVELTDIAPTILESAGVDGAQNMAGRSLRPLLTGETEEHRDSVRSIYFDALSLVNPERTDFRRSRASMIRTKTHKLCVYHGTGVGELFDMEADPGEHTNLWNDPAYAGLRLELTERGFDAAAAASDTGPEPTRVY